MGILWLIIKIILFVLLALLGLIILGLLIILISPISYEAYLEKYDELIYDFKFTYLGLIRGHFCLGKGYKNHEIKAFGKVLYEDKIEDTDSLDERQVPQKEERVPKRNKTNKRSDDRLAQKKSQPIKKQKQATVQKRVENKNIKDQDQVKEIDTPIMENIQEGAEEATHKVTNETKSFARNLDTRQMKELLFSQDFWQLIKEIWHVFKSIIKYILPREWSYELVIGKEDPAETGELLAKLIMLYPLYYKHGILRGDFERSGVWGGFLAKGRFSLLGILKRIVIFLCRPVVREYIKLILKIRKEEKDGE